MEHRDIKEENRRKKEYLRGYRDALREQQAIEAEIEELRGEMAGVSAQKLDGMPHGTGHSDLSGYAAQLDDLLRQLAKRMEQQAKARRGVTQKIQGLEDVTESLVLRYRYIHGMTWEEIAERMHYSRNGIVKVHGRALEHLEL